MMLTAEIGNEAMSPVNLAGGEGLNLTIFDCDDIRDGILSI